MGPGGWEYAENVKNSLFLTLGVIVIIVLQFIEVNSRYLQELIVHLLITGFITDQIQRRIDDSYKIKQCHYGIFNTESDMHVISSINYVSYPYRVANICHTDNRMIIGGRKSQKAVIVSQDKIKDIVVHNPSISKRSVIFECIDIVTDYDPSNHSSNLVNLSNSRLK
jgi:hypothetical protein